MTWNRDVCSASPRTRTTRRPRAPGRSPGTAPPAGGTCRARAPAEGEPWAPKKLYYSEWTTSQSLARHRAFLDAGLESPYPEEWFKRESNDHRVTTRVEITGFTGIARRALIAHATQIDPESTFWF